MTKRDLHAYERDLRADLAISNAATPGEWQIASDKFFANTSAISYQGYIVGCGLKPEDARFIAEARTGWPHAIERALAAERELPAARALLIDMRERFEKAEAEVERLRDISQALYDSLMEALEYVPGEMNEECPRMINEIRAIVFEEEATI